MVTKGKESLNRHYIFLLTIPILLMILGFIIDTPKDIISGLYSIIISPSMLLVDYIAVGGLGATLINVSLLTFACILLVYKQEVRLTGPLMAGIITVCGFGFMGKNILNVLPIFLGGYLYSKFKGVEFKTIVLVSLFATTLGPAVTFIAIGMGISNILSIPLALLIGTLIGFLVPPMSAQMLKIHDGYNLYNIGFTGGMLGLMTAGILRSLGYPMETQSILSIEYSNFLRNLILIISTLYIVLGYFLNNKSFKGYGKILKLSGRLMTDFTDLVGYGNTYINMGLLGLISTLYVILVKGVFNGPVVAGLFTVIGFAAFGKHPKNSIPVILGVYIAGFLTIHDVSSTSIVISALFGTTLAPIAGGYGFLPGVIAGFLHVTMVTHSGAFHGGLNLYNNGFSGGLVAAMMLPILNVFIKNKIQD